MTTSKDTTLLHSGIPGLDSILHGGLPAGHAYLVTGASGTGKTTLAMQFLIEGAIHGESTVFIGFSESLEELYVVADAHGWPIDRVEVIELASRFVKRGAEGSSIFRSAEVELPEAVSKIMEVVEAVEPTRVAIDSLTELRNMAETSRAYRRALFQLKVRLEQMGTTTLLMGGKYPKARREVESVVHGVIDLYMDTPVYGAVTRHLEVKKMRGRRYESGFHDFAIVTGGLEVFPRIRPREIHRKIGNGDPVRSGVESLDKLVGGGLDHGTTTLLLGASGTGKTTTILQYAVATALRGERAVVYSFNEGIPTMKRRAEGLDMPLAQYIDRDLICIRSIDPAELTPGHFAHLVRQEVTQREVTFVAIDSINGYHHAMPDRQALVQHLQDLLTYLGSQGILMMLVMTLGGLLEATAQRVARLSYLADTILLFEYLEEEGVIGKSIAAIKHRTRNHEKCMRRLSFGPGGLQVGEQLTDVPSRQWIDAADEDDWLHKGDDRE